MPPIARVQHKQRISRRKIEQRELSWEKKKKLRRRKKSPTDRQRRGAQLSFIRASPTLRRIFFSFTHRIIRLWNKSKEKGPESTFFGGKLLVDFQSSGFAFYVNRSELKKTIEGKVAENNQQNKKEIQILESHLDFECWVENKKHSDRIIKWMKSSIEWNIFSSITVESEWARWWIISWSSAESSSCVVAREIWNYVKKKSSLQSSIRRCTLRYT